MVVVRAQHTAGVRAKQVILAGAAASVLLLGAPQSSLLQPGAAQAQESAAAVVYEQEALIQEEKSMLQFSLQQQENAKRAALLGQRAKLQAELNRVEAAIQARLNQQKANVVGARQAGDEKALQSAESSVQQLEQQRDEILRVAAQLSAQIDRMEILERAKSVAAKQSLDKAAAQADSVLNNRLGSWLEAMGKGGRQ